MTKSGKRTKRKPKPKSDFHGQMVLFQWALGKLGVKDLKDFCYRFQISPDSPEGLDERTGLHHFYETIAGVLQTVSDGDVVSLDKLREYEQHILEYTQFINTARLRNHQPRIDWKYHQYLALLFTEMFLDKYFYDPDILREELNARITAHNDQANEVDWVEPFSEDESAREQLARLAFWCATGSGKTLLMHIHIQQFRYYHKVAYQAGKWPDLDQIILVTPNDGLSRQHEKEFIYSGLNAVSASEQGIEGLFSSHAKAAIKILDIHKFREDQGKTTVATERFEGCNLILVDEGHRGAGSGEEGAWMSRRDQLAKSGFCMEYSATFKEAVKGDEDMRKRYTRSILFDYSYRSFYRDGYGKDFTILNLENDNKQKRYLTAALLMFYQQMKVWKDGVDGIKPFLIDKPLWIFVGHTVVKGKNKPSQYDKESVSDVVEVLLFLKNFLANNDESIDLIQSLLEEGFVDSQGRDVLAHMLPHIDNTGDKQMLAKSLHTGILREIFQAPGGGSLTVQMIKNADGELALKVGDGESFGVVNVGDPVAVADACADNGITRLEDDIYRSSLFHGINHDDSPINLLVGSRKFTEGWNSWRVSSIGLMRMGKSEGTQIIQLFGRGVRLRGYKMSLRRSSVLPYKPAPPKNLRQVETLQVFGVKATYMNTFKDWIFSEIPEAQDRQFWDLPVVKTLPKRKLKTLQLKEEIEGEKVERGQAFRKLGPLVILIPPHDTSPEDAWLRNHPTRLNWLPRIQGITGQDKNIKAAIGEVADMPEQKFTAMHIALLDMDELLFRLEAFKATRGLDRLHADRESIRRLLENTNWYQLFATADDMRFDQYGNRTQWLRMAEQLINNYAERFYMFTRRCWEAPYIEVVEVSEDDSSIPVEYSIESTDVSRTAEEIEQIAELVQELKSALDSDKLTKWSQWGRSWRTVPFAGHLYQPLLYVGKKVQIRISPVCLVEGEAQFVDDLADWCSRNTGIEIYLLRNKAVTGLGFFQAANFYPDFLLWVHNGKDQHLSFVDPKGLGRIDVSDPKIQFATNDIPRLQTIIDRQDSGLTLSAFIISNTPYIEIKWSFDGRETMPKPEIEKYNVLFQNDDSTEYIASMMQQIAKTQ